VLVQPDVSLQSSYLAAMAEEANPGFPWLASGLDLTDRADFAEFLRRALEDARPDSPRPREFVATTLLWWVVDATYLGRVTIRHELIGDLVTLGGHIGYWIRPSARRQGHGRAAFSASLPHAQALGLDPVLLTCDHDNEASRRIIESAGGRFENRCRHKLRYWVRTATTSLAP
jgi:predicted acetyltransferase